MNIISIGHDIIEIERIRRAIDIYGEKFLQKIYTTEELRYSLKKSNAFPSLAVRFAAKEAVAKALMSGIGVQFHWKSAFVTNQSGGSPQINLDSLGTQLLHALGGSKILVSLTHSRTIASAMVLII